jgi:hypothetical protein
MALQFANAFDNNDVSISRTSLSFVNVVLFGDGSSTDVSIDLSQSPFNLDFKGNPAQAALLHETVPMTVSLVKHTLTLTLASALGASDSAQANIGLKYE